MKTTQPIQNNRILIVDDEPAIQVLLLLMFVCLAEWMA